MTPLKPVWIAAASLAFVLLWFGLGKFTDPVYWQGWIPGWTEEIVGLSKATQNTLAGITEITLAALLLLPKTRLWAARAAALYLLFIITTVTRLSPTGIRDIGLMGLALSLSCKKYAFLV